MNGSLTVQYNSGKIQSYRNFILDTKTGSFFQLENDFGVLWSRTGSRKTPWVNGSIQYDANENIYILFSGISKNDFEQLLLLLLLIEFGLKGITPNALPILS